MMLLLFILLLAASDPFDTNLRAGLVALQQGDLATAQAKLEAARDLQPRDGRVWIALSQIYWRQQRNTEAEAAAEKAASFGPDNPAVQQGLTIYYSETNQPLKAARASSKLPDKDRAAALYFDAAQPLLKQQQFSSAATVLAEATKQFPANVQLQLALGVADYGLRRFDDAADAFLRTIALAPETEQPYTFLGRILDQIPSRLPQVAEKLAMYQAAHPDNATACFLRARALDAQGIEPETSLRLLDKAVSINSTDPAVHFERGIVLDRFERFAEAAQAYEKSATLNPDDAAAHYRLARDYDRLGKHEAAQTEREKHARLVKARNPME